MSDDAGPSTGPPPHHEDQPVPTIEELIERSSLGTPGAKALRSRTPPEVAEAIVARASQDPAYRAPVQPPHGWEGRQPRHFDPPSKTSMPGKFSAKVVGVSYVPDYPSNLRSLGNLAGGPYEPSLILRHNPDNPYDANAVEVLAVRPPEFEGGPVLVGHLPRALAPRVAAELDAGKDWRITGYEVLEDPRHADKPGLSINARRFD